MSRYKPRDRLVPEIECSCSSTLLQKNDLTHMAFITAPTPLGIVTSGAIEMSLQVLRVLVFLCLLSAAYSESVLSDRFVCPSGWVKQDGDCLFVSDVALSQSEALRVCGQQNGYLVNIFSMSRNEFIRSLISSNNESVWIGLWRDSGYADYMWHGPSSSVPLTVALWGEFPTASSLYYISDRQCATMGPNGFWYPYEDCNLARKFVCQTKPDCADGWTGDSCREECHCASFRCGSRYSSCPFGCQPGWSGSSCDQEKQKAEVVYYCQNTSDSGPRVTLRIDTKGVNYVDFRALNEHGLIDPTCSMSQVTNSGNPSALTVTVFPNQTSPCRGYQVANTTWTYQWTFWLAEFKNVLSEHDFIFTATCDFTKAETMQRAASVNMSVPANTRVVPVAESHENVTLMVVDPDMTSDLRPLTETQIGTRVRLVMMLSQQAGVHAKGIAPKNCRVSAADGGETLNITDFNGCATTDTPVSRLTGNGTLLQTDVFSIFSFRQSYNLLFTCSFDFCFNDGDRICQDPCSYRNYPGYRRKRSWRESDNVTSVVAYIRVLPTASEQSQESTLLATDASWRSSLPFFLIVAIVVMVTTFLALLYVQSAWRGKKHGSKSASGYVAVPQHEERST